MVYILFAWDKFYPSPGSRQIQGVFTSLEKAHERASLLTDWDLWEIVGVEGEKWEAVERGETDRG